jgi:hypothetical protein
VARGPAPLHHPGRGLLWVREIKPLKGVRERAAYFHDHETGKDTPADKSKIIGTHYDRESP